MGASLEKLDKLYLTFATSGTTTASAFIPAGHSGWIKTCRFEMPATSAASISATLYLYDGYYGDVTQITSTNVLTAQAASAISGMEWPVEGKDIVQLTLNAIPGSAAGISATPLTAELTFYLVP
mgnify:CR=1 FL=1